MNWLKKIATVFDQYPHMNNLLILILLLIVIAWLVFFIQEWRYKIIHKHSGAKNFEAKIEVQKQELIMVYDRLNKGEEKIEALENKIRAVKNILY